MPNHVWRKIVDDTRGWGVTYRPFMQNEPLVEPRLVEIIRYIKEDETAKVELNTNAELLTEKLAEDLLDAGLDSIRVSIDGHSKEIAESIRQISYEKVRANTVRFLGLVRERGNNVETCVRMIDLPENKHEQDDFVSFWGQYAQRAHIVPWYTWAWDGAIEPVDKPCPKVLDEMFFYTDGRAALCCWDTGARGIIGDVNRESVRDIWFGETNRKYRKLLGEGRRGEILLCSKCDGFK